MALGVSVQGGAQKPSAGSSRDRHSETTEASNSPYSVQYETIVSQGHDRPPPAFGAPTLVWHVGVWPRRFIAGESGKQEQSDPHDTAGQKHADARTDFVARREKWVAQFGRLLTDLQRRSCDPGGGAPGRAPKTLNLVPPHELAWGGVDDFREPIKVLEQETVPLTLWWRDRGEATPEKAVANAIRVSLHCEVNADYVAITFYMDIGQRWNDAHSASPDPQRGARRARLLRAVDDIASICESQLEPTRPDGGAPVDGPAVPEALSADAGEAQRLHEALKATRNLLYVDIWEQFAAEMGCRLGDIAGERGEVFANFRGLIMSTRGLDAEAASSTYQPQGAATASVGTVPFANFSRSKRFNADGAEANAVAKAFWPFMRRVTPRADYRDFIACGVLHWRAIYMTALGSHSQYVRDAERKWSNIEEGEASIRVPRHLLNQDEKHLARASDDGHYDSLVHKRRGTRGGNNHPVRYLLLTKHEPHPRQIGRIAERINTMGTMRLFALKDWAAIRNADPFIRILGQELDQITESWGDDRQLVNTLKTLDDIRQAKKELEGDGAPGGNGGWDEDELKRLKLILPRYIPKSPVNFAYRAYLWIMFHATFRRSEYQRFIAQLNEDLVADVRHSALYHISSEVETQLIDISAEIDRLGSQTIGGLHFRLNRSAYYVREFHTLLRTLQVGNIPTWTSYEQFVRRGLAPAFDYMASVGRRLRAVRTRLLAVTEMIETSALVGQSAATRHNTAVLRQTTTLAIVILMVYLALNTDTFARVKEHAVRLALRGVGSLYRLMPDWMTTQIDRLLSMLQPIFQ